MDILKITKSKTREKILLLFFLDVDKRFYLRELERILGISVANIRRELISLQKMGLFVREKDGNQVYYSLDKRSPVFDEVKKIVSKTIGVEASLKVGLKEVKGIERAFIFGSFAKGEETSSSDIDVMIIGNVNEDSLIAVISKLEKDLNREINYHLLDKDEWNEGKTKKSFLKNILSHAKIEIL